MLTSKISHLHVFSSFFSALPCERRNSKHVHKEVPGDHITLLPPISHVTRLFYCVAESLHSALFPAAPLSIGSAVAFGIMDHWAALSQWPAAASSVPASVLMSGESITSSFLVSLLARLRPVIHRDTHLFLAPAPLNDLVGPSHS